MSQTAAAKRWCCTINNPTEEDYPETWLKAHVDYYYFAPEVGAGGTPHLQGFFVTKKPIRLTGLKKLHATAHFEKMRGTIDENFLYCSKQQLPDAPTAMEWGERPNELTQAEEGGERERKRWKRIHELARDNDVDAFVEEFPAESFLHFEKFKTWHARRKPKPVALPPSTLHRYYWGEPGTGKSRTAREQFPDAYVKDATKWWQNYAGEKVVIIDDMDPHHLKAMTIVCLKTWFDLYPFPAEIKGGDLGLIRPELFIVTSNFPLDELCQGEPHLLGAMRRRFRETEFKGPLEWGGLPAAQGSYTEEPGEEI